MMILRPGQNQSEQNLQLIEAARLTVEVLELVTESFLIDGGHKWEADFNLCVQAQTALKMALGDYVK